MMLNFITAYRPPCLDENLFLTSLETQLSTLDMSEKFVLMGDLNFDLLSARGNRLRHFVNCMNLVDDTKITRIASGTLLNVFVTNQQSCVTKHYVEPCPFSDHCFVICDLLFRKAKNNNNTIMFRRLNDDALASINHALNDTSFAFLRRIEDVNDRWILLKQVIVRLVDLSAPKKKLNVKSKRLPWLDADCFRMKYLRDKHYRLAIKSKLPLDWVVTKQHAMRTVVCFDKK